MIPLEKKLIDRFDMSKFVVCTDAGLSSATNRFFNDYDKADGSRAFVTTQSIKKRKQHLKDWFFDTEGWYLSGDSSGKLYSLNDLDNEADKNKIFFKSRWIKEKNTIKTDDKTKSVVIEQQLIVSYSIKYRDYLRSIRNRQVSRAESMIASGSKEINRKRQTDPKRFIKTDYATSDGEMANISASFIDKELISCNLRTYIQL